MGDDGSVKTKTLPDTDVLVAWRGKARASSLFRNCSRGTSLAHLQTREMAAMVHLLDLIYEYQLLTTKQGQMGIVLDETERARLSGLRQLLLGETRPTGRRDLPRLVLPIEVQFTVPGGFGAGDVVNVSGSGVAIRTSRPPMIGTRILLRLVSLSQGAEYAFPGRVIWRSTTTRQMGIAFDGIPTKTPRLALPRGAWERSIRFGSPRLRHAVA